jgi:ferric-dicitrate binding protein FerR (iron transport regulator)
VLNRRDGLTSADVSSTFRALSEEHGRKRGSAERAATWQLIERRLVARHDAAESSRWSFRVAIPAVGFTLAVAAGVAFAVWPSQLQYEVRGAEVAAGWIRSRAELGSVRFSDGSEVGIHPGSSLSIEVVGAHAARTELAQGDLDVSVKHEQSTDFRFLAGPYQVRVVGTKFHLVWRPEQQLFSVAMREGRVQVTGPNGLDRAVSAGETLRIAGGEQSAVASNAVNPAPRPMQAAASNAADPAVTLPPQVAKAQALAARASNTPGASAAHGEVPSAWAALVAKGQFSDVVRAAETIGTERVLRERGASEISALAHAAHYTGHGALAISAWSALRERFPGQKPARQAAFFLGRVFDQQGRRAEALRWLNTYLGEAPADVYSSEALGRKLTLVNKLEGPLAAKNVAREYLKRFPQGAYAHAARAILDED